MINFIKNKIIAAGRFIKAKLKWLLIATGIIGMAFAYNPVEIPEHLQIKTAKENILNYKNVGNKTVQYAYKTNIEIVPAENEIIERRTPHSQVFRTNNPNEFIGKFYLGNSFYKQGEKWFQTKYGTTTDAVFRKFLGEKLMFIKPVFATTTNYPTSAGDGICQRNCNNVSDTYLQCHNYASGNSTNYTSAALEIHHSYYEHYTVWLINRMFLPIDTSSLGGAIISSATLHFYAKKNNDVDNDALSLIQTSQASTSTLSHADYDQVGTTKGSDTDIDITSLEADYSAEVFVLNATGRGWIDKNGWTKLGIRNAKDITATEPAGRNNSYIAMSEHATEAYRPYLEVVYTNPMKINISDSWKDIESMKININDEWKNVEEVKININNVWKTVY